MRLPRLQLFATVALAACLLLVTSAVAHEGEHDDGEVMRISDVVPGGAAEVAGLAVGDRILAWDGKKIATQQQLSVLLYRAGEMAEAFGLDLTSQIEEIRACTDHDAQQMAKPIPQTWCDNVFKVHCSGLDLLAEIGDAQIAKCAAELSASLGVDVSRNKAWNTCGEQKVFDRYSMRGEASDETTCRRILIEECGAEIED